MSVLVLISFMESISFLVVIRLFTQIKSKERENLRWISTVIDHFYLNL